MAPYEFIISLGRIAPDNSQPEGFRLFCALFLLAIFASLRFSDTIEVADMWRTKTALAGRSAGQKLQGGEPITRAAVRREINPNGAWINPVIRYRGKVKPAGGTYRCVRPYFPPSWEVDFAMPGSSGVIQHARSRAELKLGPHPEATNDTKPTNLVRNVRAPSSFLSRTPREARALETR